MVIAHKVNSENVARNVGGAAAAQISERTPGRAITNRWGQIQAFYLDKSYLMAGAQSADGLTPEEKALAERAMSETDGKISLEVLMGWGMGHRDARRLQDDWKLRGWAANDPVLKNSLYITSKLADLLPNCQARQTLPNTCQTCQTGLESLPNCQPG